jgi:hypothetical protein
MFRVCGSRFRKKLALFHRWHHPDVKTINIIKVADFSRTVNYLPGVLQTQFKDHIFSPIHLGLSEHKVRAN